MKNVNVYFLFLSLWSWNIFAFWTCSMHPEVHTKSSGSCPICHMDLIEVKEKAILHAQKISGRKSIVLDQKKFSLSGAKMYEVKSGDFDYEIKTSGKMNGANHFSLYVSEKDQHFLKNGSRVVLKVPSMDLMTMEGTITNIDSYIEPMGRTIRVDGTIKGKESLKAETSLLASILFHKINVIKIPEEAVLHTGDHDFVFKLDAKKSVLDPVAVVTGAVSKGMIEIKEGLNVKDMITTGANFLIDSESRMKYNAE